MKRTLDNIAIAYLGLCVAGIAFIPADSGWRVFALFSELVAAFWLGVARWRWK